jgi:hypothetical protein
LFYKNPDFHNKKYLISFKKKEEIADQIANPLVYKDLRGASMSDQRKIRWNGLLDAVVTSGGDLQ